MEDMKEPKPCIWCGEFPAVLHSDSCDRCHRVLREIKPNVGIARVMVEILEIFKE